MHKIIFILCFSQLYKLDTKGFVSKVCRVNRELDFTLQRVSFPSSITSLLTFEQVTIRSMIRSRQTNKVNISH